MNIEVIHQLLKNYNCNLINGLFLYYYGTIKGIFGKVNFFFYCTFDMQKKIMYVSEIC